MASVTIHSSTYLLTVLAVVAAGGLEDWLIEFWHTGNVYIWMSLGQVVHKHPSSLESQKAGVALVLKLRVVCRVNLKKKSKKMEKFLEKYTVIVSYVTESESLPEGEYEENISDV